MQVNNAFTQPRTLTYIYIHKYPLSVHTHFHVSPSRRDILYLLGILTAKKGIIMRTPVNALLVCVLTKIGCSFMFVFFVAQIARIAQKPQWDNPKTEVWCGVAWVFRSGSQTSLLCLLRKLYNSEAVIYSHDSLYCTLQPEI